MKKIDLEVIAAQRVNLEQLEVHLDKVRKKNQKGSRKCFRIKMGHLSTSQCVFQVIDTHQVIYQTRPPSSITSRSSGDPQASIVATYSRGQDLARAARQVCGHAAPCTTSCTTLYCETLLSNPAVCTAVTTR